MISESTTDCPLCGTNLQDSPNAVDYGWRIYFNCQKCGQMGFEKDAQFSEFERIVMFRALKENISDFSETSRDTPFLDRDLLKKYFSNYPNYSALELLDKFIISLCANSDIGKRWDLKSFDLAYHANCRSFSAANWCQQQAVLMGWLTDAKGISIGTDNRQVNFTISARGWERFYELEKSNATNKRAFLAMGFSNDDLREKIVPHLKIACSKAGYILSSVDEDRQAGLIDNKIRVEIRTSRFLVVDVSDGNQGAYFEAGFAEGLGKPVFYICDKLVFDKHHDREDGEKGLHFDIEHHDIIQWDVDNPENAAEELLASIRNTLPDEAKMTSE